MRWFARPSRRAQARPLAEEVEPRILYSADLGAVMLAGAANDTGVEQRTLTASGDYATADTTSTQLASSQASASQEATAASPTLTAAAAQALYAVTPLSFEANAGQAAAGADFIARGNGYGIALSAGGADLALGVDADAQTVRLNLEGGNAGAQAEAGPLLVATSNYIVGCDPAGWHTGIANYGDVTYRNVYDGVDVRYYGNQQQLEYDFLVKAGANPDAIRLRFDGITGAAVDGAGNLVLTINGRGDTIVFKAPVSYQEGANGREAVASSYKLNDDGSIGFSLGAYDAARALVIDPVLNYASYFGTSGADTGLAVAVDAAGSVYVTGRTTNAMANNLGAGGGGDVYVAKFSADLSSLIYSTRIGGTGDEQGNAIAVDSTGAVSVTGWTKSTNFPTVAANQGSRSGGQDAFVFRLNPGGTALSFSTYLGGLGATDEGNGIAVDAAGNVYAAGRLTQGLIPITIGLGGIGLLGGDDAFVTKFNSSGVVQYSALYGGSVIDYATAIAVDSAGNAYIVGHTDSNNLPMVNAQDSARQGPEGFLAKVNAAGNALLYSSYVGGSKDDLVTAIAVDNNGKAYIAGTTTARTSGEFFVTAGAFQTTGGNDKDSGFVRVYDTTLSGAASLLYSSFLGGSSGHGPDQGDVATGIAVGPNGRIVIVGTSDSTDFPITADAWDSNNTAGSSMFLVVLDPLGGGNSDMVYGTFFGTASTSGNVVLQGGRAIFTGTTSTDGLATTGVAQPARAGGTDAIVVAFTYQNNAPVLSGTNDLSAVLEDALTNTGTLVSDLIAGHVTDTDAGPLSGIAVTGVDNSNGTWQYSRNGGAGWSSFGSPTDAAARLLVADALTRVRFVPNANFAGTLAAGLTFRAWDRSTGTAGTTANTTPNGGQTAYSSATASAGIVVTAVNDAPVRTAGVVANRTVAEDSGLTSLGLGALAYGTGGGADEAAQLLTYTVTAVPASGIVVLADGVTLVTAGTSYTLADLQGMQIRTVANGNGGPGTFSWTVRDDGGTANGGADSLAESLTITVTAVNDAPVLAGANNLPAIAEDSGAGGGMLVSALIAGQVSDPDAAALTGIAVVGVDNSNGTWQYSRDGGDAWANFGAPSDTAARLLAANASTLVRFVPNANFAGTVTGLTFRAWDQTSGAAGTSVNASVNGGATAFSGATASASITVTAVNDAPIRTAGTASNLTVTEDAGLTSLGLGTLAYGPGGGADEAGQGLTYTVTAVPALGLGQVMLADGVTAVSAGTALSLAQLQGLQFLAAPNASGGPATLSWRVQDDGGTAGGGADSLNQSLSITVTAVNDAPVLAGSADLTGLLEDATANPGTLVSTLIAGQVSDADAGALSGIAVVGVDNSNGAWQFSLNGGSTWTALGSPSDASARLLSANAATMVRFVPNADFAGTVSGLSFRAWDRTTGTAGFTANASVNGGSTAFSAAVATANIAIASVNDQPLRTAGSTANLTVQEDAGPASLGLGGLAYGAGGGADEAGQTFTYTVTAIPSASLGQIVLADGTTAVSASTSYTLAQLQGMQFKATANGNGGPATFSWSVTDSGGTANGGVDTLTQSLTVSVTAVNDQPVRTAGVVANLTVQEDSGTTSLGLGALSYGPGGGADEAGQALSYSVTAIPAASLGQIVLANGTTVVTASTTYTLAQLQGMQFKAAANASGGPATFSWTVQDSGGTANGGVNTLAESLTISVASVNDQPVRTAGVVGNLTVQEDAATTGLGLGALAYNAGGGAAEAGQTLSYTVTAVPAASLGQIVLADGTTVVSASTSYTLAQLQGMQFKAAADANGGPATFSWSVQDSGGTANGGADTLSESLTISVTPMNDQPVRTAGVVGNLTLAEDAGTTSLGLGALSYGPGGGADEAGQALSYSVTAIPAASLGQIVLADGTTAVSASTTYTLAQLQGMQFKAAANASGGPATFSWTVLDSGGTANGGVNTLAESLTISVASVNDQPVRTAGVVGNLTVQEDAATTGLGLGALTYNAGGGAAEAGQTLSYTVTAVPAASLGQIVLADGTTVVSASTSYTLAQLQGMQFKAAANANGGPATFSWNVQDSGGTANGGADTLSESLTISVTAVNDAPVRTAGSTTNLTLAEDAPVTSLGLAGLAYSAGGGADEAGQTLGYTVTAVPAASLGQVVLADGTTVVSASTTYTLAQLQGMQFKAVAGANGGPAAFSWTVQDSGGTAGGGVDVLAESLTISVTSINDQPVLTAGTINNLAVLENSGTTSLGLTGVTYGPGGGADEAGQVLTYTVLAVPGAALGDVVLADGTTVVLANTAYSLAQLQGMQFRTAAPSSVGAADFIWRVQDDGGTANGGVDTLVRTLHISVGAVNDPPERTAGAVNNLSVLEDAGITSLGLGGLAYGPGGGVDEAGQTLSYSVTAVPPASLGQIVLANGTTVVTASTTYTLAQLQGMQFKAAANANGGPATFSWAVQDNGGVANGGSDRLVESLTVSVTPVNDQPVRTAGSTNNLTVLEDSGTTSLGLGALAYDAGGGADEAGQALGYTVTAVPAASLGQVVLANGTTVVTAGTSYTLAQLQGMQFKVAANANGGPASFSWSVTDSGGTANGGVNSLGESLTLSVTPVNDQPVRTAGSINNLTVLEDSGTTSLGLGALAYGAGGGTDEAGQTLSYTVTAVPAASLGQIVLANGTTVVTASTSYTLAQLHGMQFKAAANANGGPATFSWSVTDSGGTANGGVNSLAESLSLSVTSVNDPPVRTAGVVGNVTVLEDSATTSLGLAGLAYNAGGGADEAGQTLSYTVTAVPAASLGQVVLANGTTVVTAGTSYTLAQLQGMQFNAAANANGGPATFSWTVRDNGGTAGGGNDSLGESLSLSVTPVNDQPLRTAGAVANLTVPEDSGATGLGLGALAYGAGGGADEAGQTLTYTVTAVPAVSLGQIVLADGTTAVTASTAYTLAQLQGMQFKAAANANGGPATFSWSVTDSGGTANGGVNSLGESLTLSVTSINDAPVRTAGNINNLTVLEDSSTTSLGLGALAYGAGGGADEAGQALSYTVTAIPAASLGQVLLADGTTVVTASTSYTLAQLQGMQFRAAADASGGPAAFSWTITDSGGTANGGINTLSESLTLSVTGVNDAPVRTAGVTANLSVLEDAGTTSLGLGGLAYSAGGGAAEAGQTLSYTISTIPAASLGQVLLADGTTVVTASTSYTLAQLQGMQFKAAANGNGGPATFSWSVTDNGGTANGGVDTLAQSLSITVTAVNDPPVRTAGSTGNLTVQEDSGTTSLGLGGLAYSVGGGGDEAAVQVLGFTVTAVPAAGLGQIVLADGTTAVAAGTSYTLAQLQGMQFKAAANASGGPASFSWTVQDNGGTANGGLDSLNESLTISVGAVNDPPVRTAGSTGNLTLQEDSGTTSLGLGALAYGTGGGADEAGQTLSYTVTAVPSGSLGQVVLADGTTVVVASGGYTLAQLQGMQFKATANAGGGPATFSWTVRDSGGTANGGIDTLGESLTISVAGINDPPVRTAGSTGNLTVLEDAGTTSLGLAGLAYSAGGGADEAGQTLSYTVTAIPAAGLGQIVLADGTTLVAASTSYTLAQLQGMQFKAAANANGGPATFSWSVQDSGGTANGGVDTLGESLTISVTGVNDQPVRTAGTVSNLNVLEGNSTTGLGLAGLDYGAGGGADEAGQLLGYTVNAVPPATLGDIVLADGVTLVMSGASYSLDELRQMQFRAAAGANGTASFSWSVADNGGTANSGVDTLAESLTITVGAVNDAPVRTGGATAPLAVAEDAPATSLGLSGLAYGPGGGADEASQVLSYTVTAVPPAALGQVLLADGTTVVLAGSSYTLADLQGMVFLAAPDANGGPAVFSWDVVDNGGTAFGGNDTLHESLTVSVSAVNDAPVLASGSIAGLTVLEDSGTTPLGLAGVAFGAGGGSDEAAQALSYTITAVPDAALADVVLADGVTRVVAGASYSLAELQGMQLRTVANANGGPAVLAWTVRDDGGTAQGGSDTLAESLEIRVTPVNDAPRGEDVSLAAGAAGEPVVLDLSAFKFADPADAPANQLMAVRIVTLPDGGLLTLDGKAVTAGQQVAVADIAAGKLQFAPASTGTASFTFVVLDDGGTANGGANADTSARTLSLVLPPALVVEQPKPAAPAEAPPAPPAAPAPAAVAPAELAAAPLLPAPTPLPAQGLTEFEPLRVAPGAVVSFDPQGVIVNVLSAERRAGDGIEAAPVFDLSTASFASRAALGGTVYEQFLRSLRSQGFIDELDRLRDEIRKDFDLEKTFAVSATGVTFGVSFLYVLWLIRGGVLMSSYLAALPAWRVLDPLPVLSRAGDEESDDEDALGPITGDADDPVRTLRGF